MKTCEIHSAHLGFGDGFTCDAYYRVSVDRAEAEGGSAAFGSHLWRISQSTLHYSISQPSVDHGQCPGMVLRLGATMYMMWSCPQ